MDIGSAAIWFLAGAALHHLVSKIMGLAHGVYSFQEMEKFTSVYIVSLVKDVGVLLNYRLVALKESGVVDTEEIEKLSAADRKIVEVFKKITILGLKLNCPKYYLPYLKYSNWGELEDYAKQQIKKGKDQNSGLGSG